MLKYLKAHTLYDADSPGVGSDISMASFSHCIKLWEFDRPTAEKLHALMPCHDFFDPLIDLIEDFNETHRPDYHVVTAGRSGGHIVLRKGEPHVSGHVKPCALPCPDFKGMATGDVRRLYDIVRDFDRLREDIMDTYTELAKTHEPVKGHYTQKVEYHYLKRTQVEPSPA